MAIKSIKIKNLLSFDELIIDRFEDINCIVGRNNTGKSNLLKLIKFFYNKLEGKRELTPVLNSNYSTFGTITVIYDISRINHIVTSDNRSTRRDFFGSIYRTLFSEKFDFVKEYIVKDEVTNTINKITYLELTLKINSNDSIEWSIKDINILKLINYLYPFFEIQARHINLYDWDNLWYLISRLKSFNVNELKQDRIIDFFDKEISESSRSYRNNIERIQDITKASKYSYREKVLNYIKAGLKGHTFKIENEDLEIQSDGTNSHKFIEIFLDLFISLTRREYIEPIVYVDEPEIGLHPKRNEELIYHLYDTYSSFKKKKTEQEKGKYKTPYPVIIFATHSPNIVKQVIKLFPENQQILHFSKPKNENTSVQKMNSNYQDKFLNIFSDNEARLFFSQFVLFVEGETEVEIFGNRKLLEKFSKLKEIDVYKSSSNVLSGDINPSSRNTAVPYLFLFDADKIFEFHRSGDSRIMRVKNKNPLLYILPQADNTEVTDSVKEFNKIINAYSKGYFNKKNKKYLNIVKNMNNIKKINSSSFTFNDIDFKVKERENYNIYRNSLKEYLEMKNILFNNITMEETLINEKNKELFFEWLKLKYDFDINTIIYREHIYYIYKERLGIGNIKLHLPREKKIRYIQNQVENEYLTESILIEYIRVMFYEGKFEIQLKLKHLSAADNNNLKSKKIYDILNKTNLKVSEKTSGWATEFLNFAINEIEKNRGDNTFRDEFKKYFEELYDIIVRVEKHL